MKKYLFLTVVALGLVAWTPTPAKAAVHFSFGFGVPGYYGYYGPYYATIRVTLIITIRIGIMATATTTTVIGTGGSRFSWRE